MKEHWNKITVEGSIPGHPAASGPQAPSCGPLTAEQHEALDGLRLQIINDFMAVKSLARVEALCGRLPDDLRTAYKAFEDASLSFEQSLAFHGVRR